MAHETIMLFNSWIIKIYEQTEVQYFTKAY